jgi:negative regulator of flagellin synthesis FlgM
MRITNGAGLPAINETAGAPGADALSASVSVSISVRPVAAIPPAGEAETLKLCRAEMQKLPDVDAGRVAEIKAALLDGRISFDAQSLAARIARYHGGPR